MTNTFADNYEETLVPVIFRPWAQELIDRAAPKAGEDVLDLACGTGAVTRELAATGIDFGSLTGADLSAGMLAVARARAEAIGLDAVWVEADVTAMPFSDDRFDLALCQQALQFFPDRVAALSELARVLKPSGRAVFAVTTGLDENPLLAAQAAALEAFAGPRAGAAVRAIVSLPDANVIRADFAAAGFADIGIEKVTLRLHHPDGRGFAAGAMGGMHEGNMLAELDEGARQACFDDFLARIGECYRNGALDFPHVAHIITARK